MYSSLTDWQAENFIVTVFVGGFHTEEAAAAFGRNPMRLVLNGNRLSLYSKANGEEIAALKDEQIVVRKLADSARGKAVVTDSDYQPFDIRIAEFSHVPALRSFGSLAYGTKRTLRHDRLQRFGRAILTRMAENRPKSGVVCGGLIFKAYTIRYE